MKLDSAALGQIIREERKAQGLLQVELAAASGVGFVFSWNSSKASRPPNSGERLPSLRRSADRRAFGGRRRLGEGGPVRGPATRKWTAFR